MSFEYLLENLPETYTDLDEEDVIEDSTDYLEILSLEEEKYLNQFESLERFIDACELSLKDDRIDIYSIMSYIDETDEICKLLNMSQEDFNNLTEEHIEEMHRLKDDLEIESFENEINILLDPSFEVVGVVRNYYKRINAERKNLKEFADKLNAEKIAQAEAAKKAAKKAGFKLSSSGVATKIGIAVVLLAIATFVVITVRQNFIDKVWNVKIKRMKHSKLGPGVWKDTKIRALTFNDFISKADDVIKCSKDISRISNEMVGTTASQNLVKLNQALKVCNLSVGNVKRSVIKKGKFNRLDMGKDTLQNKGYNESTFRSVGNKAQDVSQALKRAGNEIKINLQELASNAEVSVETKNSIKAVRRAYTTLMSYANSTIISQASRITNAVKSATKERKERKPLSRLWKKKD